MIEQSNPLDALLAQGMALSRQGRVAEAAQAFRHMLQAQPHHVEALHMLGLLESQMGRAESALALLDLAVQLQPGYAMAQFNRGRLLQSLGRLEEALRSMDAALAADAGYARAHLVRADMLAAMDRADAALESYAQAVRLEPSAVPAHIGMGNALYRKARYAEALACFERAVELAPQDVAALLNSGCSLMKLARPSEAAGTFAKALAAGGDSADVHFNHGLALAALSRHAEAVASYTRALELAPRLGEALRRRAASWTNLGRPELALADFDSLLLLTPEEPSGHAGRAGALFELGYLPEAVESYERALALDSQFDFAIEGLVQARMAMCDWTDFDRRVAQVKRRIEQNQLVSPSQSLAFLDSAPLQQRCAQTYAAYAHPQESHAAFALERRPGRLRIGYFSADLFSHATAYLMAGLFEHHDRERFEIFAFSFGRPAKDEMHERLVATFEHFIDVSDVTDEGVVAAARQLGIDIAVDLKGLTKGARPRVFAMRAAPVQISYLGYPCTMGAPYMDYIVADSIVAKADGDFTEKIICMPHSYQVNDDRRAIAESRPSRAELALPQHGFVFCCFNNLYKITPDVFEVWMNLLNRVEGSVLWMLQGHPVAMRNLRRGAQSRGVAPERLLFADRTDLPEHLARHGAADLFLDTLPYNAHTTASDALWAGLPVLTCAGETFAGRVAASLLHAVGLPELVTGSLQAYEEMAVALSADRARLQALKERLEAHRLDCPLFDTSSFARDLESAFVLAHDRHARGLPPARLEVRA